MTKSKSKDPNYKSKYYQVGYTKAIGGRGIMTVKAGNRNHALSNAKNLKYTGKDFYILREVKKPK